MTVRRTAFPDTDVLVHLVAEAVAGVREASASLVEQALDAKKVESAVSTAAAITRMGMLRSVSIALQDLAHLSGAVAAGQLEASERVVSALRQGLAACEKYLIRAGEGSIGSGLPLHDTYAPVAQIVRTVLPGHRLLSRQELFLPVDPVFGHNSPTYNEGRFIADAARYQSEFRKAARAFQAAHDTPAVNGMRTNLVTIETKNPPAPLRLLVGLMIAHMDALVRDPTKVSADDDSLVLQLDEQLSRAVHGDLAVDDSLVSSLLYALSRAAPSTSRLKLYHEAYELSRLIEDDQASSCTPEKIAAAETAMLNASRCWEAGIAPNGDTAATKAAAFALVSAATGTGDAAIKTLARSFAALASALDEKRLVGDQELGVFGSGLIVAMQTRIARVFSDPRGGSTVADFHWERVRKVLGGKRPSELTETLEGDDAYTSAFLAEATGDCTAADSIIELFLRGEAPTETSAATEKAEEAIRLYGEVERSLDFIGHAKGAALAKAIGQKASDILRGIVAGEAPIAPQAAALADALMLMQRYLQIFPVDRKQALLAVDRALAAIDETGITPTQDMRENKETHETLGVDSCTDAELGPIFFEEARSVIEEQIRPGLQDLRSNPTNTTRVEDVRRGFHTLKGSARMVELTNLGNVGQAGEYVLNYLLGKSLPPDTAVLQWLGEAADVFARAVNRLAAGESAALNAAQFLAAMENMRHSGTLDGVQPARPAAEEVATQADTQGTGFELHIPHTSTIVQPLDLPAVTEHALQHPDEGLASTDEPTTTNEEDGGTPAVSLADPLLAALERLGPDVESARDQQTQTASQPDQEATFAGSLDADLVSGLYVEQPDPVMLHQQAEGEPADAGSFEPSATPHQDSTAFERSVTALLKSVDRQIEAADAAHAQALSAHDADAAPSTHQVLGPIEPDSLVHDQVELPPLSFELPALIVPPAMEVTQPEPANSAEQGAGVLAADVHFTLELPHDALVPGEPATDSADATASAPAHVALNDDSGTDLPVLPPLGFELPPSLELPEVLSQAISPQPMQKAAALSFLDDSIDSTTGDTSADVPSQSAQASSASDAAASSGQTTSVPIGDMPTLDIPEIPPLLPVAQEIVPPALPSLDLEQYLPSSQASHTLQLDSADVTRDTATPLEPRAAEPDEIPSTVPMQPVAAAAVEPADGPTEDADSIAVSDGSFLDASQLTFAPLELPLATVDPQVTVGSVRLAEDLYTLFVADSAVYCQALQKGLAEIVDGRRRFVSYDLMRMAHSLTGLGRTTGFAAIAALGEALERWLEVHLERPIALEDVVSEMLTQASESMASMVAAAARREEPAVDEAIIRRIETLTRHAERTPLTPEPVAETVLDTVYMPREADAVLDTVYEPRVADGSYGHGAPPDPGDASLGTHAAQPSDDREVARVASMFCRGLQDHQPGGETERGQATPEVEPPHEQLEPQQEQQPQEAQAEDTLAEAQGLARVDLHVMPIVDTKPAAVTRTEDGPDFRAIVASREDDFDPDMFAIFCDEAAERFEEIDQTLSALHEDPASKKLSATLKRAMHTLKGSANTTGLRKLGGLFHFAEDLMDATPVLDLVKVRQLQQCVDAAFSGLDALKAGQPIEVGVAASLGTAPPPSDLAPIEPAAIEPESIAPTSTSASPESSLSSTPSVDRPGVSPGRLRTTTIAAVKEDELRVPVRTVDRIAKSVGELSINRARMRANLGTTFQSLSGMHVALDRVYDLLRSIELEAEKQIETGGGQHAGHTSAFDALQMDRFTRLQELTRRVSEARSDIQIMHGVASAAVQQAEDGLAEQGVLVAEVSTDLTAVRQVRVASVVQALKRVVRVACRDTQKEAQISFDADVQVDRGILEKLIGPLEHILRNAVAHGIEPPEARERQGKPTEGSIEMHAFQDGSELVVEIRDDGRGIDPAKVLASAISKGLVKGDAELTDDHIRNLVFEPGFSTATSVTDIAGRGVGLDVVRAEVSAMGGRVEIRSTVGVGTTFVLRVPSTLTVIAGTAVETNGHMYVVPVVLIDRAIRVQRNHLESAYKSRRLLVADASGATAEYEFWGLWQLTGAEAWEGRPANSNSVILLRNERIALHVDEVYTAQQYVFRPMGPQITPSTGLIGSTINAQGNAALVLDPARVARSLRAADHVAARAPIALHAHIAKRAPLVLIVDDSTTVRKVTARLLQSWGYRHAEAENGLRALEKIQEEVPAVILMDIEMPVMNGFEATQAIRANSATAHTPVIMITSRVGESHRAEAQRAGVNDYLGKPFAQNELKEAIAHQLQDVAHAV